MSSHPSARPTASGKAVPQPSQPWWREPMMWLVVGGPAIVVVAALVTGYIAMVGQDPVLDRSAPTWQVGQEDDPTLPAREARNHVVHAPKAALPRAD